MTKRSNFLRPCYFFDNERKHLTLNQDNATTNDSSNKCKMLLYKHADRFSRLHC